MKRIFSTRTSSVLAFAIFSLAIPKPSDASTLIDWLTFKPGADRTHFGLVNDVGQPLAQAQINIAAGTLAPLSPGAGSL